MAGIRKKFWTTSKGEKKYCYEITYYLNGKQVRKSGFKTQQEAQMALPSVTKSYSSNITVKDLVNNYIEERLLYGKCKESTAKLYRTYLNTNLTDIQNVKAKRIKAQNLNMLVSKWKSTNMTNKSINNILKFLRSVYNFGIKNKWISENPLSYIENLPKIPTKIKFLEENKMYEFLEVIKEFPLMQYTALYTAIYTGMRISELLALEWSDIDFKNNTISVNKQFYKNKLSTPKTYKSTRIIHIPSNVTTTLAKLKKESKVMSKIIFCGKTGSYINQNKFVRNYFKKAAKAIGKADYNFHCLRHTYATFMLSHNKTIKLVQEQLGHSTPITTMNTYTHTTQSDYEQAMNLLENFEREQSMSIVNY